MRQVKIFVAPCLVSARSRRRRALAGAVHGGVEGDACRRPLACAAVEHGRQIGAAAEPPFAGDDHARVHVHGRHIGVLRMRDQRDARGPEARVAPRRRGSACGTRARTRRCTVEVWTPTFSNTRPVHQAHDAAAARRARMIRALPGRALEAPGGRSDQGAPAGSSSSSVSNAAQMVSRSSSNQARALCSLCRASSRRFAASAQLARPCLPVLEPFCWRNSPYISRCSDV